MLRKQTISGPAASDDGLLLDEVGSARATLDAAALAEARAQAVTRAVTTAIQVHGRIRSLMSVRPLTPEQAAAIGEALQGLWERITAATKQIAPNGSRRRG